GKTNAVVKVALAFLEGDGFDNLSLGRQFAGNRVLGPTQQKWGHALCQRPSACAMAILFDRRPVVPLKLSFLTQQSRLCEIKQGPQLSEVILDGGAGQGQTVLGAQRTGHGRYFGTRIFDRLCFVENDEVVIVREQHFAVELQQRVACYYDVDLVDELEGLSAAAAVQDQAVELGREAVQLLLPVAEGAHRRNDQGGFAQASLLFLERQVREGLDCLSQSHIVGKDAAKMVPPQKLQPAETFLLVRTQVRPEIWRCLQWLDSACCFEVVEKRTQVGCFGA